MQAVRVEMSPLRTLFSMTLLTRLALGSGPFRPCGPEQPQPTITPAEWDPETARRNPEYRLVIKGNPILAGTYRNDITVFCTFSDASTLTIRDARDPSDLQEVQAVQLNSTTIEMLLKKPNVGHYSYYCTDSNTNCTDALDIQVRPAMSVMAPQVHHTLNIFGKTLYFVPLGEQYDVFCSSQQITDLSVSWDWKQELEIKPFNETTVMATVTNQTEAARVYCCGSPNAPLADVLVMVDYYPDASEFKCVFYEGVVESPCIIIFCSHYSKSTSECSWKSLTKGNTFKLFVLLRYDQESRLVCIDRSGALAAGCTGLLEEESTAMLHYHKDILFRLETCNYVFCSNQTFNIKIQSSKKVRPVYDLEVKNVTALGATVSWSQHNKNFNSVYKIEYKLMGTDWFPVNTSAVQCEYRDVCRIPLALPCPDSHYELRVFMRHKEATSDVYWSEPAYIYFFTASSSGEMDAACNADFRDVTEKPPLSVNLVLYKVRELISDERKETKALKRKIDALKEQLVKVKAIMLAFKPNTDTVASKPVP